MVKFSKNWEINFSGKKVEIGENKPVFIIAEIGINHNGDINLAKKTILAAKEAGVDAVKFQNYKTEDFLLDDSLLYEYENNNKKINISQRKMFKQYELTEDQFKELAEFCVDNDIIMISTPSGILGVDEITKLSLPIIKNASDSIENYALLKKMAETGLPCILSCGMAGLSEIENAVEIFEREKNCNLALLVCTSNYPTAMEKVNLRRLETLETAFKTMVGFSDHTAGNTAAIASVILGAKIIEKHFTLDKNLQGPDHVFSADKEEMKSLVRAVREVEICLGDGLFKKSRFGKAEVEFSLSLKYKESYKQGRVLSEQDFCFARPGGGLKFDSLEYFIGKELKRNVKIGDNIKFEDVF